MHDLAFGGNSAGVSVLGSRVILDKSARTHIGMSAGLAYFLSPSPNDNPPRQRERELCGV